MPHLYCGFIIRENKQIRREIRKEKAHSSLKNGLKGKLNY